MAKIVSDAVVVEISRIAKDDEHLETIVNDDMVATLQQVVEQLVWRKPLWSKLKQQGKVCQQIREV